VKKAPALDRIDAIDSETGCVNVIVETPKGSRNKFAYDGDLAVFHGPRRIASYRPDGSPYDPDSELKNAA